MITKLRVLVLWSRGIAGDRPAKWAAGAALAVLALAFPVSAGASLGGDMTSVQVDQARIQGSLMRVTTSNTFTVHELRAATGTTIREFVSPAGKVFGVAWDGPTLPDLRQVLGDYFPSYVEAAQAAQKRRAGHGPVRIEGPTFVVEQSGHPRAFAGRAYVPQLVPAGVGTEIVR